MKIYNVIWEDRHSDTEVYSFTDSNLAIEWARKKAHKYDRFNEGNVDRPLNESMKRDGWLYYGRYSCEGDNIRVVETELDRKV